MDKQLRQSGIAIDRRLSKWLGSLLMFLMMFVTLSLVSCGNDEPEESSWKQTSASIGLMNSLADEGGCWQLTSIEKKIDGEWVEKYNLTDNNEYEYYWLTKEKVADRYDNGITNYLVYMENTYNDDTRFIKTYFHISDNKNLYINGFHEPIGDIVSHTEGGIIVETNLERHGSDLRYHLKKVDRPLPSGVDWEDWNDPNRYDS